MLACQQPALPPLRDVMAQIQILMTFPIILHKLDCGATRHHHNDETHHDATQHNDASTIQ